MKMNELKLELEKKYGTERGAKIFNTVMPGIFADFTRMLHQNTSGGEVRESYHFEDETSVIEIVCKDPRKPMEIEAYLK